MEIPLERLRLFCNRAQIVSVRVRHGDVFCEMIVSSETHNRSDLCHIGGLENVLQTVCLD